MKRIKIRNILMVLMCFLMLTSVSAYAEDNPIGEVDIMEIESTNPHKFDTEFDVSINKKWTIRFNDFIDQDTVNEQSIILWDADNKMPVERFADVYGKEINIYPKIGYLKDSTRYTIYIVDQVRSKAGKVLIENFKKDFITESGKPAEDTYIENLKLTQNQVNKKVYIRVNGMGDIDDNSIRLYELDSKGHIIKDLGFMKDNGDIYNQGDDVLGDGVYSSLFYPEYEEEKPYLFKAVYNGMELEETIKLVFEDLSYEEIEDDSRMVEEFTNIYEDLSRETSQEQAKKETIKLLKNQASVVEVEDIKDTDMILYMTENGGLGLLDARSNDEWGQLGNEEIVLEDQPQDLEVELEAEDLEEFEAVDEIEEVEEDENPEIEEIEKIEEVERDREYYRKLNEERNEGSQARPREVYNSLFSEKGKINGNYSVLLSSPSKHEFSFDDSDDYIIEELKKYPDNFNITTKFSQEADLESFKELSNYDMVFITTHGGTLESEILKKHYGINDRFVFHMIGGLSPETGAGEISWLKKKGMLLDNGKGSYLITPRFIEEYNKNFDDSLIYLTSCVGGGNTTMADAYVDRGANTFLGYSDNVLVTYGRDMKKAIIDGLLEGKDIRQSVGQAKDKHGKNDAIYSISNKKPASLRMFGEETFKLDERKSTIVNPDFETGNLKGWSYMNDARVIPVMGELSPTQGKYMAAISTGLGTVEESDSYIKQKFYVPEGVTKLVVDYNFISEEYPDYTNGPGHTYYDDTFKAYIDGEVVIHESAGISKWSPVYGMDFGSGDGTFGHTGWKHKIIDISQYQGKNITLMFRVWDVGDSIFDSAVIIDNIQLK